MSDWITDRKPTESDADRTGLVWCQATDQDEVCVTTWDSFSFDTAWAWMPRELPARYRPPEEKQKRWKGQVNTSSGRLTLALEVLPGDPRDLDTLLKAIDRKFPGVVMARLPFAAQEWIQQVVNARHGEGGDE